MNNEVKFYSPIFERKGLEDLIFYAKIKHFNKEAIQINLDNCTIQRMEKLDESSTVDDLKLLGLYPLYRILNECPNILIAALGITEMPGCYVTRARDAYNLFFRKFASKYIDTADATMKDGAISEEKVVFLNLPIDTQKTLGSFYLPYLLIQKIYKCHSTKSAVDKFRFYLYGIIHYLDMVSGFELEIAKYAFWEISDKELHSLPELIKERRKRIKKNFVKEQSSLDKIRSACLNAAMDTYWIRSVCMGCDRKEVLPNGYIITEHWLATNDEKLYILANDIKPTLSDNGFGYIIGSVREEELHKSSYWNEVDNLSFNILNDRKFLSECRFNTKIENIDSSIIQLETELDKYFRLGSQA